MTRLSGKEVSQKVLSDAIGNFAFFGAGAALIWFLVPVARWLGWIGLVVYGLLFALDLIPFLVSFGGGVVLLFNRSRLSANQKEESGQLWIGTIWRAIEVAFMGTFVFLIYGKMFP